ncbi:hypothetical protein CYJ76_04110 [Kytococcus schroeteri]|uniref:O-antigen ligase-related domain-containing protein n=2 Tax=Kytococcus TaxID=57499 RepID=A0A2I1PC68_9MICO|nr:O-antigen ligase family protein [Kytococcus schroeteri]PKZ42227.1 hypothetical protein CYJ76_04110 [Kytococcus schroeteri]
MNPVRRETLATVLRLAAVVLLLGVLPLVSTPGALDVREPVRRVVIAAVMTCTAGLWWVEREDPRLPRPVWWAMGAVGLAAVLATWLSTNSWLSVVGRYPRNEGLVMIGAYLAALPAGALLFAHQAGRRWAVWTATASGWVLVWMGVRDATGGSAGRVVTALGNASTVGFWGLMLAAWLGWVTWRERSRVALAGAVAGGALLVLGASRGALLGLFVGAALSLVLVARTEGVRRVVAPAGVIVAGVVAVLALPITRDRIFLEQEGAGTNITVRLMMWRRTARLVLEHPEGVGPSRWVASVADGYGPAWQAEAGPGVTLDAVHNVVLQTASTLGVVGLLAVTALAVACGQVLWRAVRTTGPGEGPRSAWSPAALVVGVGFCVALMFAYTEPVFVVPGAALVGGGLAAACRDDEPLVRVPRRWSAAERARAGRLRRGAAAAVSVAAAVSLVGSLMVWDAHRHAGSTVAAGPAGAAAGLERTHRAAPWDPNPEVLLAGRATALAAGRTPWNPDFGASSRPQYEALTRRCPGIGPDQRCLVWQSMAAVQTGDADTGLALALRALAMGPDDHASRTAQQGALLALGRPDLAVLGAREHVHRNPELFSAWRMLARAQKAAGDLAGAQVSQARADQLQWEVQGL